MSSAEIIIVVEGQTEQTFVRDVLAPEMATKDIFLQAALIGKPGQKGGDIRFDRAKGDIGNFLKQRPDTYISTMFDYFRIESTWPGKEEVLRILGGGTSLASTDKAEKMEDATFAKIKELFPDYNIDKRFIPYIEMHEFEALLFSDASILAGQIGVRPSVIEAILNECGEPEEVNDGPETAPSKRLFSLCDSYRKVAMGKAISEDIGIRAIREKCPHFNEWLNKLEDL
ncbi:MAG: DUF4276 family protein [Planctomycetes bacterium]|nr:DUF4276 family protein [Planctomycetota bacterium]